MSLIDKLHVHLNAELIKRLLIRYFIDKGFTDSFDEKMYPPILQDLAEKVPELSNKVEIVPYAVEIDPHSKHVRLGWNLFVLGNQRMFLGESDHTSMNDLRRAAETSNVELHGGSRKEATPKRVIHFITKVLSNKEHGSLYNADLTGEHINPMPTTMANTQSGASMWNRPRALQPGGTPSY